MRDFKYRELIMNDPAWNHALHAIHSVKSECLKPCAIAFMSNMIRSASFAMLPVEMAFQSSRNTRITANAIFRATGKGDMTMGEQIDTEATPEMVAEFSKEIEKCEQEEAALGNALRLRVGVSTIERFLAMNGEMQSSIDALYTSIVLESWLFFEAMCADLWVAGVDNAGPVICARVLANQSWESGKEQMLAANALGIQSNAKTNPGSYRREIGQVSFQKLRAIRSYYKMAFGGEADRLFDDTEGGYIYALSAMRNCITHSAGRADHGFKTSVGNRFPELSAWALGSQILLDGALVKKLRNAACETGRALIQCVDTMIQRGD